MTDNERRRLQQQAEMQRYEADNDLVPGSSSHNGKAATGGVEWRDRARMALARLPDDRDDGDRAAIAAHPNPPSGLLSD